MKKKILTAIVPVCAAVMMTACGGNAGTTEAGEITAITENAEADVQAETETGAVMGYKEAAASERIEEEEPENEVFSGKIELAADGSVNGKDFPVVGSYAAEQDKSADYSVKSMSCLDLDEFLDENGETPAEWEGYDSKESNEYSGRFAYPEITPCRFFDDLTLISRTDCSSEYQSNDIKTGAFVQLSVASGLNDYNHRQGDVGSSGSGSKNKTSEIMFTAQTVTGETEVVHEHTEHIVTAGGQAEAEEDDNEFEAAGEKMDVVEEIYLMNRYYFYVGNFSVTVAVSGGTQLTEDDIRLIIDNIRLTNGVEEC